jgi:hypothetical protein
MRQHKHFRHTLSFYFKHYWTVIKQEKVLLLIQTCSYHSRTNVCLLCMILESLELITMQRGSLIWRHVSIKSNTAFYLLRTGAPVTSEVNLKEKKEIEDTKEVIRIRKSKTEI